MKKINLKNILKKTFKKSSTNKMKKKKHPQFANQVQHTETNNQPDDFNYNRGKFHKKQHKF